MRRLSAAGLVLGTAGNASARVPDGNLFVASPTGVPYDALRPEDVSLVTERGELVEGRPPSIELPLHLAVLAARADVGAVVHTHSPYATALAFSLAELPVVTPEQAAAVGGPLPVCAYARTGQEELGRVVLAAAGERWAVVVRNHGPVCFGRDLDDAVACAFAVEESARVLWLARVLGDPEPLPPDEVTRVARLTGKLP